MKNYERVLSNYDFILALLDAGFTIKELVNEINNKLHESFTYRELLYFIQKVRAKTIHKEYDNIILIDSMTGVMDANLSKYCVDFYGLLVTYKSASHLTNQQYIITPDNLLTIYNKESLLYAKRILKLYHISDSVLLEQHKLNYPHQAEISLDNFMNKIYSDFNAEFNAMLANLRTRYVDFAKTDLRQFSNTKGI